MRIFFFFVLFISPLCSIAETVYVTDQLKLSIRAQPVSNEAAVATALSGDALEVLQKGDDGYWKVRTGDNVEGWVNSRYVMADEPAIVQLKKLQADQGKVGSGNEAAHKQLLDALDRNKQLEKEVADLRQRNSELRTSSPSNGDTSSRLIEAMLKYRWAIGAGFVVLLPLFGFLGGVRWYRRRVSARFGGLKF